MSTQTMIASDELFIGGEWIKPQGSDRITVLAASTEEPVGSVPDGTNADIDAAVKAARQAFEDPSGWSSWSNEDRARALERLAAALESRAEEAARRVSLQNGMPISLALQIEAVFPPVLARYYAGLIRQTPLQEDRPGLLGGSIVVHHDRVDVFENVGIFEVPSVARTGMHDEGRRTIHHDPGQFEVAAHASQTPVIAKCVRSASNP